MHWTWGDLMALPSDVYRELFEMLIEEQQERGRG